MWAFRKRPQHLTDQERTNLERLFEQIPELFLAYHFRWAVTDIFDTKQSCGEAAAQFAELRALLDAADEDNAVLLEFFKTYDEHREGNRSRVGQ